MPPKKEQRISLHHEAQPDSARLATATDTFRMLSDPTRLHILWLLDRGPGSRGSVA